jgi:ubiquinone/menaquinone biosynthesis C-methylase UbiE/pimeloyl-ACP methyl ester carboxylesterase
LLSPTDTLNAQKLRRLHADVVESPEAIRALLECVQRERCELRLGLNRQVDPETAELLRVERRELLLRTRNLDAAGRGVLYLNFALEGRPYFFAAAPLEAEGENLLRVEMPSTLYLTERRERVRRSAPREGGSPRRVSLQDGGHLSSEAPVADFSAEGLAVELPERAAEGLRDEVRLRFLGGDGPGPERRARICYRTRAEERSGWVRLGLALRSEARESTLRVEHRTAILTGGPRSQAGASAQGAVSSPSPLVLSPQVPIVDYRDERGERMRAIVDHVGEPRGAPAVVIPPAWGRTKETLLPLAAAILATFHRHDEPVVVVRFDGIRKRGESYNDPDCRAPGREHYRFSFSQGVRDIRTTLDFLERSPEFQTSRAVVITFSASTIEGRRAVLEEDGRRAAGWISVVGAPDMQAPLRVISGGLDYVGGAERGVRFGLQEIQGTVFDVDRMSDDLRRHRLGFLEDARRDMANIRVPVTWIHGRHDAWMDFDRVREMLSCGDASRRRLIEVPTGHQLRTSDEALQVFQLIASEIARITLGRELAPALPDLAALERRRRTERKRLPTEAANFRAFWHDYLLGRDGELGIELMTAASAYRELMHTQIEALRLEPGMRVADLGSGTGSLPLELLQRPDRPAGLVVDELDYVGSALRRARQRLATLEQRGNLRVHFVSADLEERPKGAAVPLASARYDAVIASLVLSYVSDPARLLRESFRLLRPGGRLVLSTLRRDADTSKLYVDMVDELRAGRALELFGEKAALSVADAARRFLNDAARLLDFEEQGCFHFWDPPELSRLVGEAGFEVIETRLAFGDPPQAVVLSALHP